MTALRLLRQFIGRKTQPSNEEEYVRLAFLVLLRRPIDDAGLRNWRDHIKTGRFNHRFVIRSLLESDEYLGGLGADVIGVIHRSREAWIKTVPAFDRVLDIGGSSTNCAEGALIELGYPYRPSRIDILDLPLEKQFSGKPNHDQSKPRRFDWGEVSYFHNGAEQIESVPELQGRLYDCVYLGQAIEISAVDLRGPAHRKNCAAGPGLWLCGTPPRRLHSNGITPLEFFIRPKNH